MWNDINTLVSVPYTYTKPFVLSDIRILPTDFKMTYENFIKETKLEITMGLVPSMSKCIGTVRESRTRTKDDRK